jgi:hypothetical protein
VNVDGSRIASYNGGNIAVTSQTGDINAGSGGSGFVNTSYAQLGPDGIPELQPISIAGSGILAISPDASSAAVGNIALTASHGSINANLGGVEQVAFNGKLQPNAYIAMSAGKDIDAGNSGVIGSNIRAQAGGNVSGVFVGTGGVSINAGNNFSGTVVGSSGVSINAGGTVSGSIVGGEGVSVSGESILATLIGGSVSTVGDASGASEGVSAASVPQEAAKVADDATTTATEAGSTDADDELKKKRTIALAEKTGRVTVVLPGRKSEN